ncbi:hypothetical protein HanXRQr2_Chr07g0312571 [Helianthus annuus]|uniref:Uncharacterized protein n=1 Tax=Helianthus annuus TaxID=4232 RepID=A0A251UD91_HELAN|nr:hypothetical protein HanXRQr2_Chr07g0312571 [Helianthus annuus]KAJ0906169.1 hypothetical protein HanPSC8_Chr07g0302421 [Helianthus annuus]
MNGPQLCDLNSSAASFFSFTSQFFQGLWLQIRYMTTIFPRMNFFVGRGMCWEDGVIQAAFL